ncbi:helix-turn-helix transcriptional regulator [Pyruvatibacter mobilis]|uniref:helix-turn-helix transcriptional regulator n=1 Tax=Pyruvatibacter mobilis TaxID=1712261 RepID=UPI003BAA39F3
MTTKDDLLYPEEAARVLAVSPSTLKRLKRDGTLPFIRVSARAVRYHPDDLEAYKKAQRTREADTAPPRRAGANGKGKGSKGATTCPSTGTAGRGSGTMTSASTVVDFTDRLAQRRARRRPR